MTQPAPTPPSSEQALAALRARVGEFHFRHRITVQRHSTSRFFGPGRTLIHPENLHIFCGILRWGMWMCGVYPFAHRRAQRIELRENTIALPHLPKAFDGFRLLHLSDLHIDLDPGIAEALYARVEEAAYDACIITGDFRAETHGPTEPCLAACEKLMAHLNGPVYGILGNHDYLEMTPFLEAMGIQMLLNEHAAIERDGAHLYLIGVDDPHFYETENFEKALAGVPRGGIKLLLAHSAEIYRQALAAEVDYVFSGHTHGGQLCFPWGQPVSNNARQPRVMLRGPWTWYGLRGYTSNGSGCSMVPVRLFAPPEITVHTLRAG